MTGSAFPESIGSPTSFPGSTRICLAGAMISGATLTGKRYINWTPTLPTGPSDAFDGDWYVYAEATNHLNEVASFSSPIFDFSTVTTPEISFHYHMFGQDMGSLTLQGRVNSGQWQNIVSFNGPQADQWFNKTLTLPSLAGKDHVRFRFVAQIGSQGDQSDIAIDLFEARDAGVWRSHPIVDDEPESNILKAFPNPFVDRIEIEAPGEGTVQIIALNGQVVFQSSVQEGETMKITTADFAVGNYVVRFSGKDGVQHTRIVKQ